MAHPLMKKREQLSFLAGEELNLGYVLTPEQHRRALRGMVIAHLGRVFGTLGRMRCVCGKRGLFAATLSLWQFACPHCDFTLSEKIGPAGKNT